MCTHSDSIDRLIIIHQFHSNQCQISIYFFLFLLYGIFELLNWKWKWKLFSVFFFGCHYVSHNIHSHNKLTLFQRQYSIRSVIADLEPTTRNRFGPEWIQFVYELIYFPNGIHQSGELPQLSNTCWIQFWIVNNLCLISVICSSVKWTNVNKFYHQFIYL